MAEFSEGDTVRRIGESGLATVVNVEHIDDTVVYLLAYAEGGGGYWPESSLERA